MKKLLLTLLLLLSLGFAASAQTTEDIQENFKNASWMTITNKNDVKDDVTTDKSTVTNISYSYVQAYESSNNGIILIGSNAKKGYVSFSLPENATKITLKTGASASTSAKVDIYAGNEVIKANLALDKKATDFVIDIPSQYQTKGIVYKIQNVSAKNAQFQTITYTIVKGDPSDTREVFSFEGFKNYTMPVQDVVAYTLPEQKPAITFESSDAAIAEADADGIYAHAVGSATITATWEGDATFKPGSAKFTVTVVDAANSIADMLAKAPSKDEEIYVNCPLTVVYAKAKYAYVVDAAGDATLLYNNSGDVPYETGDIVPAGWTAKNSLCNGLIEWGGNFPAATGEKVNVQYDVVESVSEADINRVVVVKDVTFTAATKATLDNDDATFSNGNAIVVRNNWRVASVPAGTYDVLCAVSYYVDENANATLQLFPIEYTTPEIVDNEVLVEVTHLFTSGVIRVDYMFEVANHYGREVIVSANIEGKDIEFVVPDDAANALARVASENKTISGSLVAQHDDLKGAQDGLTVNLTATLDNGTELHNAAYAISKTTGIEDVTVDGNEAAEYFNLQGIRVAEPQAGQIYIVRRGAKATKELVK